MRQTGHQLMVIFVDCKSFKIFYTKDYNLTVSSNDIPYFVVTLHKHKSNMNILNYMMVKGYFLL